MLHTLHTGKAWRHFVNHWYWHGIAVEALVSNARLLFRRLAQPPPRRFWLQLIADGESLDSLTSGSCRTCTVGRRSASSLPCWTTQRLTLACSEKIYRFVLPGSRDFSKKSRELRSESG